MAIADVHVGLVEAERLRQIANLAVTHEPRTWRRFAGPHGSPEMLRPDLLVELDTQDGWFLRWFIEVDRGTEHMPTVIAKCRTYMRYWRSGAESQVSEVFPRVLWSVPDENRAERIRVAIDGDRALVGDLFRVATASETTAAIQEINQQGKGGES